VDLQTLEADTVRAAPQVCSQQVPLGAGQLSVQIPRDEALGLVTGRAAVEPFEDQLLMPRQETHAYVDAARSQDLRFRGERTYERCLSLLSPEAAVATVAAAATVAAGATQAEAGAAATAALAEEQPAAAGSQREAGVEAAASGLP
jgi:hypothetical protein